MSLINIYKEIQKEKANVEYTKLVKKYNRDQFPKILCLQRPFIRRLCSVNAQGEEIKKERMSMGAMNRINTFKHQIAGDQSMFNSKTCRRLVWVARAF